MLGFKSFAAAQSTLAGVDHAHDQEGAAGGRGERKGPHTSRTVYSLAALIPLERGITHIPRITW